MTIANTDDVVDAEIVLTTEEAEQYRTELAESASRYRDASNDLVDRIIVNRQNRVHVSLGYELSQTGWEQYLRDTIGPALSGLRGVDRQQAHVALAEAGMSTRQAAAVTGASKSQVARDLESSVPGGTQDAKPVIEGSDGRIVDPQKPKRFTCAGCGKRKLVETQLNEIDGKTFCEQCADAYEPEPVAPQQDEAASTEPACTMTDPPNDFRNYAKTTRKWITNLTDPDRDWTEQDLKDAHAALSYGIRRLERVEKKLRQEGGIR